MSGAARFPCLSLVVACTFALGCTSKDQIARGALTAFSQSTSEDTIRLPTTTGSAVEFGPNATLRIIATHDTVELPAANLYSNDWGLFQKNGDAIGSWDDIERIDVEQFDGAATVAVSACAAIAIVIVAALLKGAPSGSGSKGSSSSGSSGGGKAPRVRSAPNAPTSGSAATDPTLTDVAFRTAEALANSAMPNQSSVTIAPSIPDDDLATAMPLFSRGARRRANVRVLARLEGGACWPGGGASADCITTGARAGLRLLDFVELSGGVRIESNATKSVPLATLGAMLHGESPAAHWFAIALGASVAFDGTRAHVIPQFSVRFRPFHGIWLGVVPVEPVYATETGNWAMASGVEITGEL